MANQGKNVSVIDLTKDTDEDSPFDQSLLIEPPALPPSRSFVHQYVQNPGTQPATTSTSFSSHNASHSLNPLLKKSSSSKGDSFPSFPVLSSRSSDNLMDKQSLSHDDSSLVSNLASLSRPPWSSRRIPLTSDKHAHSASPSIHALSSSGLSDQNMTSAQKWRKYVEERTINSTSGNSDSSMMMGQEIQQAMSWHQTNSKDMPKGISDDTSGTTSWQGMTERIFEVLSQLSASNTKEAPPPPELLIDMYGFQKVGLAWMINQEKEHSSFLNNKEMEDPQSQFGHMIQKKRRKIQHRLSSVSNFKFRGGILADEMGLGKTIQTLALILTNKPPTYNEVEVPLNLAKQETTDIPMSTTSKVKRKRKSKSKNSRSSVFLSTESDCDSGYETGEASGGEIDTELQRIIVKSPVEFPLDEPSDPMYAKPHRSLGQHNTRKAQYDPQSTDGGTLSDVQMDIDENRSTTLIVCPLSTLHQWVYEIKNRVKKNVLTMYVHHGTSRTSDPAVLKSYNIVLTTYGTVQTEHPNEGKITKRRRHYGPLFLMKWYRVVLDEAHIIKEIKTSTAKACCALDAERRWCLTGTPVQNKLDDFYALFKFLHVVPFSQRAWWEMYILRCDAEVSLQRLRTVLGVVLLQRRKNTIINGRHIVTLPTKIITVRTLTLSSAEKDFYEALLSQSRVKFNTFVAQGTVFQHYAYIFALLVRLRQACCHPFLVLKSLKMREQLCSAQTSADSSTDRRKADESTFTVMAESLVSGPNLTAIDGPSSRSQISAGKSEMSKECLICSDSYCPCLPCGHHICEACLDDICRDPNSPPSDVDVYLCVSCGKQVKFKEGRLLKDRKQSPELEEILDLDSSVDIPKPSIEVPVKDDSEKWISSTKLNALQQLLSGMIRDDPTAKAVVFSQWTSFLDIVEHFLIRSEIKFARLDGTMSSQNRHQAIKRFQNDDSVSVFLISLKAGGLGLNLTAASHVFLLDPWWNPAIEEQAMDRVHRLGQTKPVQVTRFIVKDAVEERIVTLQQRKRSMISQAMGHNTAKLNKLKLDDLKGLFA